MHGAFFDELGRAMDGVEVTDEVEDLVDRLRAATDGCRVGIERCLGHSDAGVASLLVRPYLELAADLYFATSHLLDLAGPGVEPASEVERASLRWFLREWGRLPECKTDDYVAEIALLAD